MRIVITGANRGIGLGLARLYSSRGDEIHGTAREPKTATELAGLPGVTVHGLDVRDAAQIDRFAAELGPAPLDLLVHNAGVASEWGSLEGFDAEAALDVFHTNAVAPVLLTRALRPVLARAKGKVFHMSSGMASIGDNRMGGAYAYRMSKAALNMAGKTLAIELQGEGVASIVVEPGWVKTDMGGGGAPLDVATSVKALVAVFDRRGIESTGKFFKRTGEEFPW